MAEYFIPPILLAFGFSFYQADAISIFIIMALSISASLVYYRVQIIDWKLALITNPLTDIMAFVGGIILLLFKVKD